MKYEITDVKHLENPNLRRIRALKDFANVKAGDLGGWIENEGNLSQDGVCWIFGNAKVYGNAQVYGNAWVYGNACVSGSAQVCGNSQIYGNAWVCGSAWVYENAWVCENAWVYGSAKIYGNAWVYGSAWVYSGGITNKFQVFNILILKYNLTIFPGGISGGCRQFTHKEFEQLTLENCKDKSWTAEELDLYKSFLGTWRRIQGVYTREIKQSSNDH